MGKNEGLMNVIDQAGRSLEGINKSLKNIQDKEVREILSQNALTMGFILMVLEEIVKDPR